MNSSHTRTAMMRHFCCVSKTALNFLEIEYYAETGKQGNKTWARLIQKVFEANPLICPKCNSEMKVLAIITDRYEVKKILKHLVKQVRLRQVWMKLVWMVKFFLSWLIIDIPISCWVHDKMFNVYD